jgi:hypothetical protein
MRNDKPLRLDAQVFVKSEILLMQNVRQNSPLVVLH